MVFTGNKYPEVNNEADQSNGNDINFQESDYRYIDSKCMLPIDIPVELCCLIGDPPIFYRNIRFVNTAVDGKFIKQCSELHIPLYILC